MSAERVDGSLHARGEVGWRDDSAWAERLRVLGRRRGEVPGGRPCRSLPLLDEAE